MNISPEAQSKVVEMLKQASELTPEEVHVEDTHLCDIFDAVIEHLMLSQIEDAMKDAPEKLVDEDKGSDDTGLFAHECMHWAFGLGVAWAKENL